jgi:hypothetical protein
MRITQQLAYDGLERRIQRLHLVPVVEEVRQLLKNLRVVLDEWPNSNSDGMLRELITSEFRKGVGWFKQAGRRADWWKSVKIGDARACIGATIRVSGRSDLIVADLHRLCCVIRAGRVDAGVVIVPSDRLASFLRGGRPKLSETLTAIEYSDSHGIPLLVVAVEHDGTGPPLRRNAMSRGTGSERLDGPTWTEGAQGLRG